MYAHVCVSSSTLVRNLEAASFRAEAASAGGVLTGTAAFLASRVSSLHLAIVPDGIWPVRMVTELTHAASSFHTRAFEAVHVLYPAMEVVTMNTSATPASRMSFLMLVSYSASGRVPRMPGRVKASIPDREIR